MASVDLVILLALIEYLAFGSLVARARNLYGVKAPATTGHEIFERYYRVQMNTLELMVVFIPALWTAAHYWPGLWVPAVGVIYLVGRVVYMRAYIQDPASRGPGFMLSMLPVGIFLVAGLLGAMMSIVKA